MRYALRILSWMAICALALAAPRVLSRLPAPPEGVAARRYDGYAGVVRVWICEGWQPGYGTLTPWLNNCFARFEKRSNGVYVQLTRVTEERLRDFAASENPPDMLIFSPSMLENGQGLSDLSALSFPLTDNLLASGETDGRQAAIPVAMGGYLFLLNRQMLTEAPLQWSELEKPGDKGYLLDVPGDGAYISWSAATLALMANQRVQSEGKSLPPAGSGVDLGLSAPTQTPAPQEDSDDYPPAPPNFLPGALPEGFGRAASVYSSFTGDTAAAIPATQREVRRLQILADSGRAPDWMAQAGGVAFTDQLAMAAIVGQGEADVAKHSVCEKLLMLLLSEESQSALRAVRALPVIACEALYAQEAGMAQLEAAYADKSSVIVPNAFSGEWRARANALFETLVRGELSAQEAWAKMEW